MNFDISPYKHSLYYPFSKSDKNVRNLIPGFFPEFPDPVFLPGKKIARFCALSNSRPF